MADLYAVQFPSGSFLSVSTFRCPDHVDGYDTYDLDEVHPGWEVPYLATDTNDFVRWLDDARAGRSTFDTTMTPAFRKKLAEAKIVTVDVVVTGEVR